MMYYSVVETITFGYIFCVDITSAKPSSFNLRWLGRWRSQTAQDSELEASFNVILTVLVLLLGFFNIAMSLKLSFRPPKANR